MTDTIDLASARTFIRGNARILDQRRTECLFDDRPTEPVVHGVLAYLNSDGGFGHGLEPDTRCPFSQPLYAQVALEAVESVGATLPDDVLHALCDHLAGIGDPRTPALPIMVPPFADYPKAAHWEGIESFPPDLNPTASIVGLLHGLQFEHRWIDDATEWCVTTLETDGTTGNAHTLLNVTILLAHMPDRDRAATLADDVFVALDTLPMYRADPDDPAYGLTPLAYAPTASSPWANRFDADLVAAHLDALAAEQQADGGWPIRWEPPTEGAACEWRGLVTLEALTTLRGYGRIA